MPRKRRSKKQVCVLVNVDSLKNILPAPLRHTSLGKLEGRARKLYERVGKFLCPTYEQWELGFLRDTHPEREIRIWEWIADHFEKLRQENPSADPNHLIGSLAAASTWYWPIVVASAE